LARSGIEGRRPDCRKRERPSVEHSPEEVERLCSSGFEE
jgi:hypothetical protein